MNLLVSDDVSMSVSKWLVVALLAIVGCSEADTTESFDTTAATTTSMGVVTTATSQPDSTSTSTAVSSEKQVELVKLDPLTLDPVTGLEPIAVDPNSWNVVSTDGSLLVNFRWDKEARINYGTVISISEWEQLAEIEVGPHAGGITVHQDGAYAYDHEGGRLFMVDLATGLEETLDDWPSGLYFWDGLHVTPDDRIVALGSSPDDVVEDRPHYSVFVHDPASGTTSKLEVGLMERVNDQTGIFDGDIEIPEEDSPGVAWGDNKMFIVWADGPEVIEVDFDSGTVDTHLIDTTSWWSRLWTYWMPAATAKGPGLGTNSSAALSPDGRYLYISGNRQEVATADDGSIIEESNHLGLIAVDTETWTTIDTPDLTVQSVRASNGGVLVVDTTSFQPWISDYYVIFADESGQVMYQGPLTVEGGTCDLVANQIQLLCIEHTSSTKHIRLVDVETAETLTRRPVGFEDSLHANQILQDNPPEAND